MSLAIATGTTTPNPASSAVTATNGEAAGGIAASGAIGSHAFTGGMMALQAGYAARNKPSSINP